MSFFTCHIDVIVALSPQLDSEWRAFGSHLRVDTAIMNSIEKNNANVGERMLQLVEKWLGEEDQTGELPRIWETVVQAVRSMGKRPLAQKLAQQYGVQLSGQYLSQTCRKYTHNSVCSICMLIVYLFVVLHAYAYFFYITVGYTLTSTHCLQLIMMW